MRVTEVKTFLVHPGTAKNWLFVKVETDEGIYGWGEAYTQSDRDRAIETHIQELGRYLVGRSPHAIRHFTYSAYTDFASKRGAMDLYSAISAIEQALWDIVGKAAGQPVYNLLGGACRGGIRVYANGWGSWYDKGKDLEQLAERAAAVVDMGFDALKFDPFPGPWRTLIDRKAEQAAVDRARMMEPLEPFWYEEPVSARDLGGLVEAKRGIHLPVVTGEELYTKAEFRDVFENRAADIINPDVCNCGGILELKEIAAMAEAYHIAVSPHNYNSTTVGLAATLQASAVMPNFLITEYFVNFTQLGDEIAREPIRVENGTIPLPECPGLGIDLDEEALARHPYRAFPARNLRQASEEVP